MSRPGPRRDEGRQQVFRSLKHSEGLHTNRDPENPSFTTISVLFGCIHSCKTITHAKWSSWSWGFSRQLPFVRRGHNTHPPFWPQLGDAEIRFARVILGFCVAHFMSYYCYIVYFYFGKLVYWLAFYYFMSFSWKYVLLRRVTFFLGVINLIWPINIFG